MAIYTAFKFIKAEKVANQEIHVYLDTHIKTYFRANMFFITHEMVIEDGIDAIYSAIHSSSVYLGNKPDAHTLMTSVIDARETMAQRLEITPDMVTLDKFNQYTKSIKIDADRLLLIAHGERGVVFPHACDANADNFPDYIVRPEWAKIKIEHSYEDCKNGYCVDSYDAVNMISDEIMLKLRDYYFENHNHFQ